MKFLKRTLLVLLIAAVIAAAVLLVHPVRVYSPTSYTYKVFITGRKQLLDGIGEAPNGYKCYVDDSHYVILSRQECETINEYGEIYLLYKFPWQMPILNKGAG